MEYYNFISYEEFDRAAANGISKDVLRGRVERGWDRERALTEPVHKRPPSPYSKEILELAKSNGISRNTLYQRIVKRKMSPYEAATTPLRELIDHPYRDPKVKEMCIKNNISYDAFRWRVDVGGWTVERAMTIPQKRYCGSC